MTIQTVKGTMYNLQTFFGDSGSLTIGNLPTDSPDYILYMQVNGKETVIKSVATGGAESVDISFEVEDIEKIGVGQWPYGVKLCETDNEDTYIPDLRIAPNALFIVHPEVAQGTTNE